MIPPLREEEVIFLTLVVLALSGRHPLPEGRRPMAVCVTRL